MGLVLAEPAAVPQKGAPDSVKPVSKPRWAPLVLEANGRSADESVDLQQVRVHAVVT